MEDQIKCPKCSSTQITAQKQGFGAGKAAAGVLLTGGIGLLAGGINSNKIKLTCLSCGNQFNPGQDADAVKRKKQSEKEASEKAMKSPLFWIIMAGVMFVFFKMLHGCGII